MAESTGNKSTENISVFNDLNQVDVSKKVKSKNGLTYLSWASAWAEVKKRHPDATYTIYSQVIDDRGNMRFWHDDGKTGWVKVGVTIGNIEMVETLAIMDFKNKSIPAEQITSVDANKSMKRCLVKACAMHGLGLYIYEGEDLPEDTVIYNELVDKVGTLAKKKAALSEEAKAKVLDYCKKAEKEAFPDEDETTITGNITLIKDSDILTKLHKQLLAIRK